MSKNPYKKYDCWFDFGKNEWMGRDAQTVKNLENSINFNKNVENLNKDQIKELYPDDYEACDHKRRHTFVSDDGMYLYFVGIIDYLQDYNFGKKGENALKGLIDDATMISAVHPKPYAERYFKFMQESVIKNQKVP